MDWCTHESNFHYTLFPWGIQLIFTVECPSWINIVVDQLTHNGEAFQ